MSRLANKPIEIKPGVSLTIDESLLMTVSASGKTLTHRLHEAVEYKLEDKVFFAVEVDGNDIFYMDDGLVVHS